MRYYLLPWIVLLLPLTILRGQDTDSLWQQHRDLVESDAHRILRPQQLNHFFQALARLQAGQQGDVVVAHIGDSHIQADYLPRTLRHAFWQQFGCAGRGLVFPYAMAGTHGPLDYDWTSANQWTYRRRTFQREGPGIGITGMGLRGAGTSVVLDFAFAKNEDISFDNLILFGDERSRWQAQVIDPARPPALPSQWQYHTVHAGETLYSIGRKYGESAQQLLSWNQLSGPLIYPQQQLRVGQRKDGPSILFELQPVAKATPAIRQVQLPQPATRVRLLGESPQSPELYGVILRNRHKSGVLYHMIGANGTTYYHYHRSTIFWEHLRVVKPDLIMITLGTNEALQPRFLPRQIEPEVRGFLRKLKSIVPGGRILLMTNPDAGHLDGRIRQKPGQMRDLLLRIAEEEEVAVYDLYAAMGGAGSIYPWHAAQLAYKDFIHFTKKGYIFQGILVYEALMQAYYGHD